MTAAIFDRFRHLAGIPTPAPARPAPPVTLPSVSSRIEPGGGE